MMMVMRNVAMTAPAANPPRKPPTPLLKLVSVFPAVLSCCMQALCVALLSCGAHCLLMNTEVPFTRIGGRSWERSLIWSPVMSVLAVILPSGLE